MASINFYLRNETKLGFKLYLFINHRSKQYKYFTDFYIPFDSWNKEKQRIKQNRENGTTINKKLEVFHNEASKLLTGYIANDEVLTQQIVKEYFDTVTGKNVPDNGFFNFIEKFIKLSHTRTNGRGELIKDSTRKKYQNVLAILKEFEEHSKEQITFQPL